MSVGAPPLMSFAVLRDCASALRAHKLARDAEQQQICALGRFCPLLLGLRFASNTTSSMTNRAATADNEDSWRHAGRPPQVVKQSGLGQVANSPRSRWWTDAAQASRQVRILSASGTCSLRANCRAQNGILTRLDDFTLHRSKWLVLRCRAKITDRWQGGGGGCLTTLSTGCWIHRHACMPCSYTVPVQAPCCGLWECTHCKRPCKQVQSAQQCQCLMARSCMRGSFLCYPVTQQTAEA
jgi:hypothetical protein